MNGSIDGEMRNGEWVFFGNTDANEALNRTTAVAWIGR